MHKKVIIIGSGVAALATAVRLARNNYQVTVLEANKYVGGKLCETHHNGFRFDRGPSLFTMPFLVDELLDLDKNNRLPFEYEKLDMVCNYFFADGVTFTAHADTNKFIEELKLKLNIDGKYVSDYLEHSKKTYQLIGDLFLQQSLQPGNFLNLKTLKALFHLPHYRLLKTLHQHNQAILKHPKLVQYFDRFATYNGSSPYSSPAMLAIVSHIEHGMGAFFPKKGMYQITDTLYNLAKKFGVEFKLNCPVSRINTRNDRVISVNANNIEIHADIVISNMDVFHTYKKLLPEIKHPDKILNQEKSSSALIFYWGINKIFPELDLHNIFFSANYQQEFDHIFNKKEVYQDPTIYINITSKKKTDDAPEGCENWFVMVNAPNNNNQDWEAIRQTVKQNCIKKLNAILQTNIEDCIIFEDHLDPVLIEKRTSSYKGALYGNASNNKMAAFLRHPNSSKTINGLYFCGGSVHPGGGIPLALLSGKITAELITKKYN